MKIISLTHARAALAGIGVVAVSVTTAAAVTLPASAQTLVWSVVPSPSPGPVTNALYGVSCISATACTAVGTYEPGSGGTRTLIESWNGTSWSVVPSPSRPGPELNRVSCGSAAACAAVGTYHPGGGSQTKTLIMSLDGTSWSVVPSPSPGPEFNRLDGVSCVSAAACTAVGTQDSNNLAASRTLIESGAASG
jgi:hypothetical protein